MYLSLWEQQSPIYTSFPFDSLCEHVFHACLEFHWVVWHKERAGCLHGEGACMEMVCQALFTLASTGWGNQLPNCCLTSSFPPRVTPPPCSLSLSRAQIECTLQDFLNQMSSRDVGQVDSSSWEYTLQSPVLFILELCNYCFSAWKGYKTSKTIQIGDTVHHGSVRNSELKLKLLLITQTFPL